MNSVLDESFNNAHNTSLVAQKKWHQEKDVRETVPLQAGRVNPWTD